MNSEEIKRLLEKYYEGNSTSKEELLLKKFFNEEDVPEDLNDEKEIFMYYRQSSQIPEPSADFEDRIVSAINAENGDIVRIKRRRLYVTLSGIAAGLLILAGSYFFFTSRSEPRDTFSDPELAYAETMKILYNVSARLNHGTQALGKISLLQDETQKSLVTINRSASVFTEKMKPLINLSKVKDIDDSNYKKN
jgi:DNA-directed RNA polymerase subunit H (RpoH/RPB5)